ncbi:MAG: outer membrane beta-barrel protein [Parachlamydiaceae bacterium]|nr:outer membrane beta-barrel protein [Parachlamydiaceae bacterium]
MYTRIGFLLVMLLAVNSVSALDWGAELRAGYYYPESSRLRRIYHSGGPEAELEVTYKYSDQALVWGNLGYFSRHGRSLEMHEKTYIRIVPFSVGFKYLFCWSECAHPYLGLGGSYTWLHVKNDSDFVQRHISKRGFGFVVKSGIYVSLGDFFADLFLDYYYQKIALHHHHTLDLGGLRSGVGLGF